MTDTPVTFQCTLTPRFTDLDTWRHVNNSRIYQLHQEARMQAHLDLHGPDAWFSDDVRLRPIRSITDFRRVTWYGSDVKAQVQVLACTNDSYRVRSELFQNGEHVGTQQAVMGAFAKGQRVDLPQVIRERLDNIATGNSEPLKPADYIDSIKTITDFPVTQQLTPRYADLDADSQRSEAALARYMEQARFGAIRHLDLGGLGILIASMDVSYLHFRAGWEPVGLRAGISRVGNSSFVFTGCATSEHGLQAVANSVMVVIDQASSRPAPMPDALREQLQTLKI
jgi:acyl-CoA thioesterase FadM